MTEGNRRITVSARPSRVLTSVLSFVALLPIDMFFPSGTGPEAL